MGEAEDLSWRFRRPFFGSFFGRTKKEREKKRGVGDEAIVLNHPEVTKIKLLPLTAD
jgi:hypothetical protein